MADYIVVKDGWIAGRLRRAGARVTLTAQAAKYEHVRPAEAEDAAPQDDAQAEPQADAQAGPQAARKRAARTAP